MSQESQSVDHYEAVLADLKAKREQIDQAIQVIEALRSNGPAPSMPKASQSSQIDADVDGPGAFLGMTIVDAAKKLLASRRRVLSNSEFAAAFKAGGLVLTSAEPINTIGSVLTRRFNQVGDVVRMGRGQWGLAEWYPGRNFKKKPKPGDDSDCPDGGLTEEERSGVVEAKLKMAELHSNVRAGRALQLDEPDPWSPVDGPIRQGVFQ